MGISDIYITTFRKNIRYYYPNWRPDENVELGDYGYLDNDNFVKLGNISSYLKEPFETKTYRNEFHEQFTGKDVILGGINGNGTLDTIGASFTLKFNSGNSAYFNATYYESSEIVNIEILGELLKSNPRWNKGHVIVGLIPRSRNTLIAVSNSQGAEVVIGAKGQDILNLNGIEAYFDVKKQTENAYVCCTNGGNSITPMFRLLKLKGFTDVSMKVLRGEGDEDLASDLYEDDPQDSKFEYID